MPCFLLFGPSGSQFLLEPSSGWIGAILSSPWALSPSIPNLFLCPYNYPLLSWYSSFFKNIDNFKGFHIRHWDLWKKLSHLKNKHFLSPKLPMSVPCHSVLLLAITRCFLKNKYAITEFQKRTKGDFGFSFKVNLLHLLFPWIMIFVRLKDCEFTVAYCIMKKLFLGVLGKEINSMKRKTKQKRRKKIEGRQH